MSDFDFKAFVDRAVNMGATALRIYVRVIFTVAAIGAGVIIIQDVFFPSTADTEPAP